MINTSQGEMRAKQRQKVAIIYYENLLNEVSGGYELGNEELLKHIE